MLPDPVIFDVVPVYGLAVVAGVVLALVYARRRAPRHGIDVSHMDLLVPLLFAIGIAGARLLPRVTGDLAIDHLDSLEARSRVFGMLAFAIPTVLVYCKASGLDARRVIDVLAVPLVLWLCCVRVGCLLAGCCWGEIVHEHWLPALSFPAGSPAYAQHVAAGFVEPWAAQSLHVHPTQIYELVVLVAMLYVLNRIERIGPQPGIVSTAALGMYAIARFGIEFLRADNSVLAFGLSVSQLAACIALAIAVIVMRRRSQTG